MRLTKLGHSCVRLDKDGATLVIDPGVTLWANQSICAQFAEFGDRVHEVKHGDALEVAGFDLHVYGVDHALIHPDIPLVVNTGFLVDGELFHPGDSFTVPEDPASTLLVPISAPWLKAGDMIDYFRAVAPARGATLDLPGWYLVAGWLCQTVWNVASGQPPEAGILDYDLAYFDASDLSWAAEDAVIQAGHQVFARLPAPVQIRNQARVHLWYGEKFGIPCRRTSPPRRPSTPTRSPPPASASASNPAAGGASMPRTACQTCSTSSYAPTRSSSRPRSTGP